MNWKLNTRDSSQKCKWCQILLRKLIESCRWNMLWWTQVSTIWLRKTEISGIKSMFSNIDLMQKRRTSIFWRRKTQSWKIALQNWKIALQNWKLPLQNWRRGKKWIHFVHKPNTPFKNKVQVCFFFFFFLCVFSKTLFLVLSWYLFFWKFLAKKKKNWKNRIYKSKSLSFFISNTFLTFLTTKNFVKISSNPPKTYY